MERKTVKEKISENKLTPNKFGANTFSDEEMKKRLSEKVYNAYKKCISEGAKLTLDVADEITGSLPEVWSLMLTEQ